MLEQEKMQEAILEQGEKMREARLEKERQTKKLVKKEKQ